MRIKFDSSHNVIQPTLVLATRSGHKLGVIPAINISATDNFNSNFDLEFQVDKYNNGVQCELWDDLTNFRLIWCKEWDVWFEIYVTTTDDNDTRKNVTCVSVGEAELSQIKLYNIEVNTEDDIARDDYSPTVLYNEESHSASLLHRILDKAPHYNIKHVDNSIAKIQRTFSFDDTSIYDALQEIATEIDCIFVIDSGTNDSGSSDESRIISRSISAYDLESYCTACGHRDNFKSVCPECGSDAVSYGYGDDTTILVTTENLADEISISTDTDSVKNCFRLTGGDDLMTATIISCNPNGSQYIWYLSDEMKKDMSDELIAKLTSYDTQYTYYRDEHNISPDAEILSKYNNLVTKYHAYNADLKTLKSPIVGYADLMNAYYDTIDFYLFLHDNLMPSPEIEDTNATKQAALLTSLALSPVAVQNIETCSAATASSSVLSVAKTLIDPRFQVKVKSSSYTSSDDEHTWTGIFTVTNYSDDTDTAESATVTVTVNDDYETFTKQKINKVLKKADDDNDSANDITSLFALSLDSFKEELKKYCLTSLNTFYDAGRSCTDILIEQGVADKQTWANKDPNLYSELYLDYYNKLLALQDEILVREQEINVVIGSYDTDGVLETDGIQTILTAERDSIQDALNMESYLGNDLWLELSAYKREDTYSNENYISDGLNNAELFERALEFIEMARKEIYKSATLQHSLSATLKNLLAIKEFSPIVDYFEVGNWIRVKIDGELWRLRLLSYSIDFDELENISVEFSDVERYADSVSDSQSIMNQAATMATSYDAVSRQASQGEKSNHQLTDWVANGLSLTKMKIIDDADNQNITWDSHGLLCREYQPITDDYSEKQLKIINRGLYLTDDDWLTSKAGIGDFNYYNPETGKMEEAYGVIADTLIGNLILSERVGVYNTSNSITLGENGFVITSDATSDGANTMAMTVQKKMLDENNEEVVTPLMYLDSDGNLVMTGSMLVQASSDSTVKTVNDLCDISRFDGKISETVHSESQTIYNSIDERYRDIIADATTQLENYKNDIGQYFQFNDDGLTLGSLTSNFKTVIDNQGLYFKEGDTTVAYVNNNQLHIPNAVIEKALALGKFFFSPHTNGDGGVSLTWQGD